VYGDFSWLRRTGGNLNRREIVATYALTGMAGLEMAADWLRARVETQSGTARFTGPRRSSRWIAEAERLAAEQSEILIAHACRTFAFGAAFAEHERADVDLDVLFVACLLHDLGLGDPRPGRCFTYTGAEAALAAGAATGEESKGGLAADAIAQHIWPGPRRGRVSLEARYLQHGSAADIMGRAVRRLDPVFVEGVLAEFPRVDLGAAVSGWWRNEARAVPRGRVRVLDTLGILRWRMRSWS
jgi:HD domain